MSGTGSTSAEKLVYMVNQIARNMALEADAATVIAAHIKAFWSPRMIADLLALGGVGLDPLAMEAVGLLRG